MAISTKTIKSKIKSVKNLKKITKTMEMISAVKTKKLLDRVFKSKYYADYIFELLVNILKDNKKENNNIFFKKRDSNKIMVILVSSNKGLCGSYNSNIYKKLNEIVYRYENKKIDCLTIGKYSEKFARKLKLNIKASFIGFNEKFLEKDIYPVSKIIKNEFLENDYEKIIFIYTNFISPIKNETKSIQLLPIDREEVFDIIKNLDIKSKKNEEVIYKEKDLKRSFYVYEPNIDMVLNKLVDLILNVNIYQLILESLTSEENSRMSAMKNASDNASDMIDDLNLFYNKTRQANITQEIIEVISGSNALN